jgi:endonuclease/exonuclease/phosphatase family metal-dependent hydrolase
MLVIQHNCRRAYAITIAALEAGLQRQADIVCLQEPYIKREFQHSAYLIYWPERGEKHKHHRVLIAIRKDLMASKNIEARTDLINHPYILALDIWDLDRGRNRVRRTRIVNCYDNWLGEGYCWQGNSSRHRRAIEDAEWRPLVEGRCLILGDFNAHSPLWNPHTNQRTNALSLENLIESFDLHINNTPGIPTRPKRTPGISIIDLAISTPELGLLDSWLVDNELPTGSDHELILMEWKDLERRSLQTSKQITGWQIRSLQADSEALDKAKQTWNALAARQPALLDSCSRTDVEKEAVWLQSTLTQVLNEHAKPVRITPFSKRWWGPQVKNSRQTYARAKRTWKAGLGTDQEHKDARNAYYSTIRKTKRECWETFLTGQPKGCQTELKDRLGPEDTTRCWQALRYCKPRATGTTPVLKGPQGQQATTLDAKEALIREILFPKAPRDEVVGDIPPGSIHLEIDYNRVKRSLFSQAVQKAPGIDQLNFLALRLLWEWDATRVVALVRQCFRLGLHPQAWKTAKGILLRKPNKPDYSMVRPLFNGSQAIKGS